MEILRVKRLNMFAKLPTRGSLLAIGLDLRACLGATDAFLDIPPGGRKAIPTGLAIGLPPGHYGRVAPRSGLALHHGIQTLGGVVDADFRGEITVVLHNLASAPFRVLHADRVAQLILERASFADVQEVADLDATARGFGGFGSSGR